MHQVLQFVISGVVLGGVYALVSVGLSLIFGVLKVVNFGQADFMMAAMYVTLSIWTATQIDPIIAVVLVGPLFFLFAWLVHWLVLERFTGRKYAHDAQIVVTLGLGIVLQAVALIIYGADPRVIQTGYSGEAFELLGFFVDKARAYAFLLAIGAGVALYLLMFRTMLGRRLQAAAEDWEASAYVGIDVRRMQAFAFSLGIALTAIGGTMLTTFRPFEPFIGQQFVVLMFVAVVLGGLGSVMGTLAGGVIVGVTTIVSQLVLPTQLAPVAVFGLFLAVLYLRPQGLFGTRVRTY